MSAYTDKAQVENYLLTDINVSFDTQVDEWIAAASAYIEQATNRVFVADESETRRIFYGNRTSTLITDDFVLPYPNWQDGADYSIADKVLSADVVYECIVNNTSQLSNEPGYGDDWTTYWQKQNEPHLIVNNKVIPRSDYVINPSNARNFPYTSINLLTDIFLPDPIAMFARWGYSVTPPPDIMFAATVITAGIINAHVKTGTAKKSETIGNYSVVYTDDKGINDWERVQQILKSYRRYFL